MRVRQQTDVLANVHFLVTRTDRLGDMVLSLPLFESIKHAFPNARLSVLASAANAEIARLCTQIDDVFVDTVEARDSKYKDTFGLVRRFRTWRPDMVLFANAKHRLAVAAWLARIPRRIGSIRRRYSILYTDRVRSLPEPLYEHEVDRALRLLQPLGIEPSTRVPQLLLKEQHIAHAAALLNDLGVTMDARIAALHPSNSGNALNAAPDWYARVADELHALGYRVVLTGTEHERPQTKAVLEAARSDLIDLTGCLSVTQLAALYTRCAVNIASSTGTAHLSAALGTPTVGLYSPLVKQAVWLPRGKRIIVLQPEVGMNCQRCLGEECRFFNCMDLISPKVVAGSVNAF